MNCDECYGLIDESGYCSQCGLEGPDFKEQLFMKSAKNQGYFSGAIETRQRGARRERTYGSGRGYTCILCLEVFKSVSRPEADAEVLELESKMSGYEEPGSDFAHFLLKQDLEIHIKIIHGGRKEYWRKVNGSKWIAQVRKLDSLNKEIIGNSNQKGSREKK